MDKKKKFAPEIVATPNFPAYAVLAVSGRYAIVGGGGGAARTGIKNKFDIYELYHNGVQTKSERVVSHEVGDACISNLASWTDVQQDADHATSPSICLALGQEEKCELLQLSPKLASAPLPVDDLLDDVMEDEDHENDSHPDLRRRVEDISASDKMREMLARRRRHERQRRESINSTLRGDQYITFDVESLKSVQTVFNKTKDANEDVYQKVVRISIDHKLLVTGGTDGKIRLWSIPKMTKLAEIKGHEKEVDDLDFRPDCRQLVSVSKPTRECCVWNIKDGKKFIQIALPTNGVKHKFYRARYGTIERDTSDTRLFTISNPIVGTKNPGIVAKWNTTSYGLEKSQDLDGTLSSLAISDNGRYLAAGTMGGCIYIIIAFSLQVYRKVEDAHSMFVTGLDWLPTQNEESKMVRGFSDASVLSISCDNTLKIHHIPRQVMMPVWAVALISAVVLIVTFYLANMFGL